MLEEPYNLFQVLEIFPIKSGLLMRVEVEDCDKFATAAQDWHDDLRAGSTIASDVTGKGIDVGDDL